MSKFVGTLGMFALLDTIAGIETQIHSNPIPSPRFVTETRKQGEMEMQEQFEMNMESLSDVSEMVAYTSQIRRIGAQVSNWIDEGDASEAEFNAIEGLRPRFTQQSRGDCWCRLCRDGSAFCAIEQGDYRTR